MKLSQFYLGALLVGALLCAPTSAQVVTILDFGSANDPNGTFEDANGDPLPEGQNVPYTETIPGGDASDPAPVAFNGYSANNINPFNVVVGADLLADPLLELEAAVLNGGATLEWTNATSWNSNVAGDAGANFFAAVANPGQAPTTFTITTADPGDTVVVEAIGSFERDALVTYGGTSGTPGVYTPGTPWTMIGSSTGTATGMLEVANVPGGGTPEGNVGAFRITITPATGDVLKGDLDLDGNVSFLDINPFINVLAANGSQAEADCNCDGSVNFLDIQPFIDILAGN